MRTTVTIESDTEVLLKEEVKRSGLSFKEVLNRSIRRALGRRDSQRPSIEPLFDAPFPIEFTHSSFNRLADELDDEETIRELQS